MLGATQYLAWSDTRGDMGEFALAALFMCGLGFALHAGWLALNTKPVLNADAYKTGDVGSTAHPRVEDATCFTYLVLSCVFAFSWLALHLVGASPLTVGMQSGACAGYEVYSALVEVHLLLNGTRRVDMLVHHSLCFAFVGMTCFCYSIATAGDLLYWHLVWDSISRMLVSNVLLNVRHFYRESLHVNASFALSFLTCRSIEQLPLIHAMGHLLLYTKGLPADRSTMTVVVCWALLQCLNGVWTSKMLVFLYRKVTGKTKADRPPTPEPPETSAADRPATPEMMKGIVAFDLNDPKTLDKENGVVNVCKAKSE